jgi:hypothetical protein
MSNTTAAVSLVASVVALGGSAGTFLQVRQRPPLSAGGGPVYAASATPTVSTAAPNAPVAVTTAPATAAPPADAAALRAVEAKVNELRGTADALRRQVEAQDKALAQARRDLQAVGVRLDVWCIPDMAALMSGRVKSADLDLTSPSFCRVDNDLGFLLVACKDVQPYPGGHKATLSVGNPLNMDFSGFQITVKWGPRFRGGSNDMKALMDWTKGLKSHRVSFADRLAGGRWNSVEVVIPETNPALLTHVEVAIDTDRVRMTR